MFFIPPYAEPIIEDAYKDFVVAAGTSREIVKDEEVIAFLGNLVVCANSPNLIIEHTINNQVWKESMQQLIDWGIDEVVNNYWYMTRAVGGATPYYTAMYQGNGEPYTRYKLVLYNDSIADITVRYVGTQRWWIKGMGKEMPEELYKALGFIIR